MLFNSVSFLIFFPIVVMGYFLIPEKLKNLWLLVASYYFYMSRQPAYALLLLFATGVTFFRGKIIEAEKSPSKRKIYLVSVIVINIAILSYFKYFNFIVKSLLSVFPRLSISENSKMISVVGISFYTFRSLGYVIDVYRSKIKAEKDFITYALFVSFFPRIMSGPIERGANLIPQLKQSHKFDYDRVTDGLVMMAWGFFKKLVVSDGAAVIVNTVFNDVTKYTGVQLVVAALLFAFQIYGDFSGYTDIAIGAAKIMGFDLIKNFNRPYFSQSVPQFWRNWHISLSSWFMDYIYIPLGGSRKGSFRTYLNLMITFLVSGLWHGPSWTYVIWGAVNGAYQVAYRLLFGKKDRARRQAIKEGKEIKVHPAKAVFNTICTFLLIDFSWIFFRANTLSDAVYVITNMFSDIGLLFTKGYLATALENISFFTGSGVVVIIMVIIMFVVEAWQGNYSLPQRINKCHIAVRWFFYYALILLILFFGNFGRSRFIYFQF